MPEAAHANYQLNNGAVIQRQSEKPDRYVLSFRSQLDTITVGELKNMGVISEIIRDETVGTVVFDLSQTSFLDASGLRCILAAHLHANEADKHLRLVAACLNQLPGCLKSLDLPSTSPMKKLSNNVR